MRTLTLLILVSINLLTQAQDNLTRLEPLRQKALDHQGRILTYKLTKSSNKDYMDLKIYQTAKNTRALITVNAFKDGELVYNFKLVSYSENNNTRLDWINLTKKEWLHSPSIQKITEPSLKILEIAYQTLKVDNPPKSTHVSLHGGIEDSNITFGVDLTTEPQTYWDHFTKNITSIKSTDTTTNLTISGNTGNIITLENLTGLMKSQSFTQDGVTRTSTLIKTEPWNGDRDIPAPSKEVYNFTTLTPDSPQLKNIIPEFVRNLIQPLTINPQIKNNPPLVALKLRQQYLIALQHKGSLEKEGSQLIPLSQIITGSLNHTVSQMNSQGKTQLHPNPHQRQKFRPQMEQPLPHQKLHTQPKL